LFDRFCLVKVMDCHRLAIKGMLSFYRIKKQTEIVIQKTAALLVTLQDDIQAGAYMDQTKEEANTDENVTNSKMNSR
jgi:hypothetical protein